MKLNLKNLIIALLLPATICFTACDTDVETIGQQILKPEQQDPVRYAAYLAALKAYKASEHYVIYASLDNAPAVSGSERAFLRSLPDSLDFVVMVNADKMTQFDIEDIPAAQAKGTKILYCIDYDALSVTMDAAAFGSYLDRVNDVVARYHLDGVTIRYNGQVDAAATAAAAAFVNKFSGKMLVAEGNTLFIPKESHAAIAYFVLNNTQAINTFNLRTQVSYAIQYVGIAPQKIILTAEPTGKLTDESLVQQPAIFETAKSVITLGPVAGLGIYHVSDDYFDAYTNYRKTKQAIGLLNPAYSK